MNPVAVQGIVGRTALGEAVDLSLLPDAQAGDSVLNFLGTGCEVLSPDRAAKITAALGGLSALMAAGPLGDAFADLESRRPSLPPIFRPRWTRALLGMTSYMTTRPTTLPSQPCCTR